MKYELPGNGLRSEFGAFLKFSFFCHFLTSDDRPIPHRFSESCRQISKSLRWYVRLIYFFWTKIGFAERMCNFRVMIKNVIKIYVCVRFRPGGQLARTAPVLLFRAWRLTGRCSTSHFCLRVGIYKAQAAQKWPQKWIWSLWNFHHFFLRPMTDLPVTVSQNSVDKFENS